MAETRVPAIAAPTEENLLQIAKQVKGLLDVREGLLGDPLDANVTYRDLILAGLAKDNGDGTISPGGSGGGGTPGGGTEIPGGGGTGYNPTTDLTPPPKPTNLRASGLFAMVKLEWDGPVYKNHAYTEIWRSDDNVLGNAILIGTAGSVAMYGDYLGSSGGAYYWIRFVSQANVTGPWNGVEGTYGSTSDDPAFLLQLLSEEITESQLYNDLAIRIRSIDDLAQALIDEARARRLASVEAARNLLIETDARTLSDETIQSAVDITSNIALQNVTGINVEANARATADSIIGTALNMTNITLGQNMSAIATETVIRTTADSTAAAQITAMASSFAGNTAAIITETSTRASADSVTAVMMSSLAASFGNNAAALVTEASTRASANSASASLITSLSASFGSNSSAIATETSARATADASTAQQVTGLVSSFAGNSAAIVTEVATRATADSTTAAITSSLASSFAGNAAAINQEAITRASSDSAVSGLVTTISAATGDNLSAIKQEATARTNADSATSQVAQSLASGVGNNIAGLVTEATTRADATSALSAASQTLVAAAGANSAGLAVEAQTRADANAATSALVTTLSAGVGASQAALQSEAVTRATQDSAQASLTSLLVAQTGSNTAAILAEQVTRADAQTSLASQLTTVSATTGSNTVAIQQEAIVRASQTGELFAEYTVKIDAGGRVSGFGLASDIDIDVNWTAFATGLTNALTAGTADETLMNESVGLRKLGDINNDGSVTAADQTIAAKYAANPDDATITTAQRTYIEALLRPRLLADTVKYSSYLKTTKTWVVNWSAVAAGMTGVATGVEPGATLFTEAFGSRRLGDIDADGDVDADDATIATKYGTNPNDATITAAQKTYIEGTLQPKLLSDTAKYGAYLTFTPTSKFMVRADQFSVVPPNDYVQETTPNVGVSAGKTWYKPSTRKNYRYDGATWVLYTPIVPFVVQATPTTLNGKTVPAGVYIDTAYIKNGSINNAQIGILTADAISAGLTSSIDITSGTFAGGRFYIGGTINYTTVGGINVGIASVTNPNVAIDSAGASFDVGYFRIKNPSDQTTTLPFEVVEGVTRIKNALIGTATITSANIAAFIQSIDFNGSVSGSTVSSYGTLGWYISKSGGFGIFNDIRLRGRLEGNIDATGQVVQVGRGIGSAANRHGLTLSESNYNNAFYRNADNGHIYFNVGLGSANYMTFTTATGVLSIKGKLTADAIDAVNTVNIAGNAITQPVVGSWNSYQEVVTGGASFTQVGSLTVDLGTSAVGTLSALVMISYKPKNFSGGAWYTYYEIRDESGVVRFSGEGGIANNADSVAMTSFGLVTGTSGSHTYSLWVRNAGDILPVTDPSGYPPGTYYSGTEQVRMAILGAKR